MSVCKLNKILVINFGGMGDLLLSTPALRALDNLYPDSYIALLTVSKSADILSGLSYLDDIFIFDFITSEIRGIKIFMKLFKLARKLKVLFDLRKKNFDIVINMRTIVRISGLIKIGIIFAIIGAKYRAGRDTEGSGFFLNIKIPEKYIGEMHESEYDLNLVKLLGADISNRSLEINIPKDDIEYVDILLRRNNINENDYLIGINPGAGWQSKRWDIEKFAEVIKLVKNNINCKIILTGTKDDENLAIKLKEFVNNDLIIATGKTTIKQLAELIKRVKIYITNDSGAVHIASAVGTPIVAIFGPGDVIRYGPIGENVVVLYKKVECSPCNYVVCPKKDYMKCIKSITPHEVFSAVLSLLKIK